MTEPYVGEIRMFAGNFAPAGWMFCQGQALSINEYNTLYQLIGTTYGGDGLNTFNLPDLRSRVPVHVGSLQGTPYTLGQMAGAETVQVNTNQLPAHSHSLATAASPGTTNVPAGNTLLSDMGPSDASPPIYGAFSSGSTVTLNPQSVMGSGGSQPHSNIQPCVAINFIISLFGIFPPQN